MGRGNSTSSFSSRELKAPHFGVSYIRIRNVGAIEDLHITLDSKSLLSLYAGNGIGKTTILECISLIGHLPCFPSLCVGGVLEESLLDQHYGSIGENSFAYFKDKLNFSTLQKIGIDTWISSNSPGRMAPYGMVELKFFDTARTLKNHALHHIFIFINAFDCGENGYPKLTRVLSRSEFDEVTTTDPTFCDDRSLSRAALVLYEKGDQVGQSYEDFLLKIAKGRTFSLISHDQGSKALSIKTIDPGDLIEARSVSYINTDLNDFGRGNDLRESPKDLKRDFGREMYNRLRIEINDEGDFIHLKKLEQICHAILMTSQKMYSDLRAVPQSFRLTGLRLSEDQFEITVKREDGTPPIPISFLSAGENEVFFVILMILNLCKNPMLGSSIILLDEPDLHIANSSRNAFFGNIIDLCEGNSQLIISTHSPALYQLAQRELKDPEQIFKVLSRCVIEENPLITRITASFDGLYLGKLSGLGYSDGVFRILRSKILLFFAYHKARILSVADFGKYATLVGFITWAISFFFFLLLVFGALLNDVLNTQDAATWVRKFFFFGKRDFEYHDATRVWLSILFITVISFPGAIAILRKKKMNKQKKLLGKLRE